MTELDLRIQTLVDRCPGMIRWGAEFKNVADVYEYLRQLNEDINQRHEMARNVEQYHAIITTLFQSYEIEISQHNVPLIDKLRNIARGGNNHALKTLEYERATIQKWLADNDLDISFGI